MQSPTLPPSQNDIAAIGASLLQLGESQQHYPDAMQCWYREEERREVTGRLRRLIAHALYAADPIGNAAPFHRAHEIADRCISPAFATLPHSRESIAHLIATLTQAGLPDFAQGIRSAHTQPGPLPSQGQEVDRRVA